MARTMNFIETRIATVELVFIFVLFFLCIVASFPLLHGTSFHRIRFSKTLSLVLTAQDSIYGFPRAGEPLAVFCEGRSRLSPPSFQCTRKEILCLLHFH